MFQTPIVAPNSGIEQYAVGPDDERFLLLEPGGAESGYTVVLNWHQELLERVPIP